MFVSQSGPVSAAKDDEILCNMNPVCLTVTPECPTVGEQHILESWIGQIELVVLSESRLIAGVQTLLCGCVTVSR